MKKTIIVGSALMLIIVAGSIILFTHPPMDSGSSGDSEAIVVDIASLNAGEEVCVMVQPLKAGDTIIYDLSAEGNDNVNLNAEFRKTNEKTDKEGYLGNSGATATAYIKDNFSVPSELAGTYYLWVGNYAGDTLTNITGTVTIVHESEEIEEISIEEVSNDGK